MRQADLANITGYSLMSIQRYTSGKRDMPVPALFEIARALDVPLSHIERDVDVAVGEHLEDAIKSLPSGCATHMIPPAGTFEEGKTYLVNKGQPVREMTATDGRVELGADLLAVRLCPKCGGAMALSVGMIEL